MRRRTLIALGLSVTLFAVFDASAIRLGGKASADRASVVPLRERQLSAILAGEPATAVWNEAAGRLPEKCSEPEILSSDTCDDDLRCGFLGARVLAARAIAGGHERALRDAANFMDRVADRLAAGGTCELDGEALERWTADRRAAAIDASRLHLELLSELRASELPVVDPAAHSRVSAAERAGEAVSEQDLIQLRVELRDSWRRQEWLGRHPGILETRQLLATAWGPIGSLPKSCGLELMDPTLLEDQWRGYLVREVVPRAMRCIQTTLPGLLVDRGARPSDAEGAIKFARSLEAAAAADVGGRSFGRDPVIVDRLRMLASALKQAPRAPARAARETESRAARGTRTEARRAPSAPASADGSEAVTVRSAERAKIVEIPSSPNRTSLVDLARRADDLLTHLGTSSELAVEARGAHDDAELARIQKLALVSVHRQLCSPLEDADPDDLEAARGLLDSLGMKDRSGACVRAEGGEDLDALIRSADALVKLRLAATLRRAARLTALGRPAEARRVLDLVPRASRGTSWSVAYAWAARKQGDHVAASRVLSSAESSMVDRFRSSGDEEVARLAAQAWLSPPR